MRLVSLRVIGLLGVLALLFAFGLATEANPASAAAPAPAINSALAGPAAPVVSGWSPQAMAGTQNSTSGEMQEAALFSPTTTVGFHLERRLKLNHFWTPEDGIYCSMKGGGLVFIADGAPMEPGLTC